MTGAAQKLSAVAAIGIFLALVLAPHPGFGQDEPEPESSPIETPQAEPTEWVPVTAADAERGGPAPSTEASPASAETPAPAPTGAEAPAPAAPSSPASMETPAPGPFHSTISREHQGATSRSAVKAAESAAGTPAASSSASAKQSESKKSAGKGAGPEIVPENSPFAGMNFGNQKGPTNIKSDSLNLDYQNKAIIFTGHVHAVQAGGDLTSDTLRVQYGKDFNDIQMMYSDGNVRMSQGTRWITSDHAVLDQGKHLLTFHGNPVVHDGEDQITGSLITVDLVSGKSTVQNPRVVIFPRESKNPDNVTAPDSP